jgi:hypothetical protein
MTTPDLTPQWLARALAGLFVAGGLLVLAGCQDLTVENTNEPGREEALASTSDIAALVAGATADAVFEIGSYQGVQMDGLADQMTSTNNVLDFWDFADQPRRRLNNRTTSENLSTLSNSWSRFNGAISSANTVIGLVEGEDGGDLITEDGVDITQKTLAAAYMVRGMSRGYIGMIYDQGYVVNPDDDLAAVELTGYSDLIAAAISDLERAKEVAQETPVADADPFVWDAFPAGDTYDTTQFIEIANSFAARFLLNEARTQAEAAAWPDSRWQTILDYANNGLNSASGLTAFSPASVPAQHFFQNGDWSTFTLGDGSGYLPTDIKVPYLLDNTGTYPTDYPTDQTVLGPAQSDDPRLAYFNYTTAFGFLSAARQRQLFSNYWNLRMWAENDWFSGGAYPIPQITRSELQYIKAEAHWNLGDPAAAAAALADSPYGNTPTVLESRLPSVRLGYYGPDADTDFEGADGLAAGKTLSTSASDAEFVRDLHTEYAVELDLLGGIGIQWFFMRRHDLLQPGTALNYPVPGSELEIVGLENYTYGGAGFEDEAFTSDGSNEWRTFDERNNIDVSARASKSGRTYGPSMVPAERLRGRSDAKPAQ